MPRKPIKNSLNTNTQKTNIIKNTEVKIDRTLAENLISLQKVLLNNAIKLENLTEKVSNLLDVFEISAKALAEKNFQGTSSGDSKKVNEKLDNLLDQNKILARGLTLLHESGSHPQQMQRPFPTQSIQVRNPILTQPKTKEIEAPKQERDMGDYQKSISSSYTEEETSSPIPQKKFKKLPMN